MTEPASNDSDTHLPVGRLAPSPTGLLHLGHARTFLLGWWHIRSRGGRILMRMEDLDGPRCQPALADAALRDLEWLGLNWDGPSYLQSQGQERLQQAVEQLVDQGMAYACVCSRADIRSMQSAPQEAVSETRYPGTCRGRFPSLEAAERDTGKAAGLRFIVPPGAVAIHDGFAPPLRCDVQREIGDFLIESGKARATELLENGGLDALYVSNSDMATGAYVAIKEKGLRIPEDIGFAMFDDPDWASLVTPGVSAVRQPVYTLGSTAADLLVKRIVDGSGAIDTEPVKIVLEARFIKRGSV